MLELGIAMKIGKPYMLILKRGTRHITDLGGQLRIEYTRYDELKQNIIKTEGIEEGILKIGE